MCWSGTRAATRAWLAEGVADQAAFRGAFFAGSITTLSGSDELARFSDVDVVVVLAGSSTPAKLGKFVHDGVLLEVTYLAWAELADIDTVERTYYLAPSFRTDQIIAGPTGHPRRLHERVAARFTEPAQVHARCQSAIARIESRMDSLDLSAPWHELVNAWMFPTGVSTHVVLVAALRNPTVRLRYLAARDVLRDHGEDGLYPRLLDLLGCREVGRQTVRHHLDQLAVAFDEAAAVGPDHRVGFGRPGVYMTLGGQNRS